MPAVVEIPTLRWESATLDACVRYRALPLSAPSADHAAANLYMWDERYQKDLCFAGGRAVVRLYKKSGGYRYLFPAGEGDPAPLLCALERECAARGEVLCFACVSEEELPYLEAQWGEKLQITESRDCEDYLYEAQKLATLSGKKLHAKRNHINAFSAAHEWHVQPLTPAQFELCLDILKKWQEGKEDALLAEQRAIERGFSAWEALALEGLLLYADGAPVAFSVGSRVTPACFCVHFEKAVPGFERAFAVINRETVRAMLEKYPQITLINREEDMGVESLRAAKLSWRPAKLLRKFTVYVT